MKVLLEWDELTGLITDKDGRRVGQHMSVESIRRPLEPVEFCQLISHGIEEENINRLMDEGMIG